MAFTVDDFQKIWASTSPLTPYEFSEQNYKEGWNFIGGTPPARQMWDFLQKLTDEKIQYIYNNMIPVGIVQAFAGATTPEGWLLCDGSAVSRTDYANLYSVIGDTYGAGDGSTTFNLPNLTDKFIEGSSTSGTEHSAGLPNITGSAFPKGGSGVYQNPIYTSAWSVDGAFDFQVVSDTANVLQNDYDGNNYAILGFDASRSSAIYGNSNTVQPPSVTMRYVIKY